MFDDGNGRVSGARLVMAQALALTVVGVGVVGCASNPDDPYGGWPGNFSRANLAPGRSVMCHSDPCTAQYLMPNAGGKTYVVRVNNLLAGEHPASGQVVDLGAYYHFGSPYRFTIDGLDVPAAVLWVGGGEP
jgi:hypothetical protein